MISRSASRVHRSPITASALAMEHSRPRDTTGTFPASGAWLRRGRLLVRIDNLAGKYRVVKSNLIVRARDWPGGRRKGCRCYVGRGDRGRGSYADWVGEARRGAGRGAPGRPASARDTDADREGPHRSRNGKITATQASKPHTSVYP